jgi:signal transduction histidine kinase
MLKRKGFLRFSIGDEMLKKLRVPLKIRLFLPISLIIVVVVVLVTVWFTKTSIDAFDASIESNLELEVRTIKKMFERESMLKLNKVETNLKVANHFFYRYDLKVLNDSFEIEVENQQTGVTHKATITRWNHNGVDLYESTIFVDSLYNLLEGTITLFQRIDSGYVRIATNVLKADGTRATGTYIPNNSPVAESINLSKTYYGRAFVVNEWYTTAYEPIVLNDAVIGMIYVGDKEKDLAELKRILYTLRIGKSGYPFVFDRNGNMIIHPEFEGETWNDSTFLTQIKSSPQGVFFHNHNKREKTIAYNYFPNFELYIAASIDKKEEKKEFIQKAILGSSIVGIIAIVLLSVFLYLFTTDRIYRFFTQLKLSEKKLASVELALKQSEKLAAMGQISAGIAHELNNPLGVITMYSNILLEELGESSPHFKDVELIVEQANRCKSIVSGLLNFARKNKLNPQEVNIIHFAKRSLESVVIPSNINADVLANINNPLINLDAEQMMQVFTNLEKNAVEAMHNGGMLTINIEGNDSTVTISFYDTGIGIAEENLEKLFTPFFTTKEMGKGTGLGLALVYGIVKMHKGKIEVESNSDPSKGETGTTFILTLPRVS